MYILQDFISGRVLVFCQVGFSSSNPCLRTSYLCSFATVYSIVYTRFISRDSLVAIFWSRVNYYSQYFAFSFCEIAISFSQFCMRLFFLCRHFCHACFHQFFSPGSSFTQQSICQMLCVESASDTNKEFWEQNLRNIFYFIVWSIASDDSATLRLSKFKHVGCESQNKLRSTQTTNPTSCLPECWSG